MRPAELQKTQSLEVKVERKGSGEKTELVKKESIESVVSEEEEKQPVETITKHLLESDGEQDVSEI